MLSTSSVKRPKRAATPRAAIPASRQCDLCGWFRVNGSWLAFKLVGRRERLWACDDCQHTLARQVDGDGVLGG